MTSFPRTEERIRPILDSYLDYIRRWKQREDFVPSHSMRSQWYAAARELAGDLQAYGIGENSWYDFVQWGCKQMQKRELVNKTPRSLCFLVPEFKGTPEDRSKYLRGLEDETE